MHQSIKQEITPFGIHFHSNLLNRIASNMEKIEFLSQCRRFSEFIGGKTLVFFLVLSVFFKRDGVF